MNCSDAQALLQRQLDGEPVTERAALDVHLAACAGCRELFGLADRLTAGLRQRRLPDPPADLTERIVTRVLRQRRGRRRLLVGVALAASVLLAVGVWTWLRQP